MSDLLEDNFTEEQKEHRHATVELPIKDWIYIRHCMSLVRGEYHMPSQDGKWGEHNTIYDEIEEQVIKQ